MFPTRFRLHLIATLGIVLFAGARAAWGEDTVHFTYVEPKVGQQGAQDVVIETKLTISTSRAGEKPVAVQWESKTRRQREAEIRRVVDGCVVEAKVSFPVATVHSTQGGLSSSITQDPVAGKSYVVARRGDAIDVVDIQGQSPPDEERQLVAAHMAAIGEPNHLARFFHGKTIRVGETVEVSPELAAQLFGADQQWGGKTNMRLTLSKVDRIGARTLAEFAVDLQAVDRQTGASSAKLSGRMTVEPNACRIPSIELSGLVSTHDRETDETGAEIVATVAGTIRVAMSMEYGGRRSNAAADRSRR